MKQKVEAEKRKIQVENEGKRIEKIKKVKKVNKQILSEGEEVLKVV